MKPVKSVCILCLLFLLLTGCVSKDDIKHLTPEEMTEYVQERVGEEIELVSVDEAKSGNSIDYVFNITSRGIAFEVYSRKWAPTIDGAVFGNYRLSIGIGYTIGIRKHYQEESDRLAKDYNVEYKLSGNATSGTITAGSYNDIESLTDFIIALDSMYAFEIKDDLGNDAIGRICFSLTNCGFSGLTFSRDSDSRLDRETLEEEISRKYVTILEDRGLTDSAVPQEIWDKYKSESEGQ